MKKYFAYFKIKYFRINLEIKYFLYLSSSIKEALYDIDP